MQRFQSHKIVEAAKILASNYDMETDGAVFQLEGNEVVTVNSEFISNRVPESNHLNAVGGYFVAYPDSFTSWSPANAFEDGYDLAQPSSGKSKIAGYRELNAVEIAHMNVIKEEGKVLGAIVDGMRENDELDPPGI